MSESLSVDKSSGKQFGALCVFVVVCFSVAATGGLFPPDDWYRSLQRPVYAPPNWVFGPVWTMLYLMISVSGWLVWKCADHDSIRPALTAYAVQLLLNGAWTAIFFGWHRPGLALIEICALWFAILMTILLFKPKSTVAAILLLPYLMWVSFAAVLNYGFWSLN